MFPACRGLDSKDRYLKARCRPRTKHFNRWQDHIMGHLKPAQGTLRFEGADLSARPRYARAALGVGYMPEDRCLVPKLTVEETFCCRYG
jgi:ABC-type lipopolysaccharide export system ATPase subunit